MALAAGGLISLPGWATGWTKAAVQSAQSLLTADQTNLLAELVETIIPTTDTPGAKSLGVHQFVQKMISDCYEPAAQTTLTNGLNIADEMAQQTYNKPFASCEATQRMDLLTRLATGDATKSFYSMVKGLTIRGYMTSEYVMTNLTHYEMAPGRYLGCVPVKPKMMSEK